MFQNKSNSGISYFVFPKDTQRKIEWVNRTGRTDWIPNKTSSLCSKHFEKHCFYTTPKGQRRLFPTAVPTLFLPPGIESTMIVVEPCSSGMSSYATQTSLDRSTSSPEIDLDNMDCKTIDGYHISSFTTETSLDRSTPSPQMDFDNMHYKILSGYHITDGDTPKEKALKREIHRLSYICDSQKKKIKKLHQQKRRNKNKINLEEVLEMFKLKKLVDDTEICSLANSADNIEVSKLIKTFL